MRSLLARFASAAAELRGETPQEAEPVGSVFIARQPIFTVKRRLHAFELLYRARNSARSDAVDGNHATEQVIANSLTSIGLPKLAGNRRVFLNFTRELLLSSLPFLLPARSIVIELLEDIDLDDELIGRCVKLREAGYELALDDVVEFSRVIPMAQVVQYVKVDLRLAGRERAAEIARSCANTPLRLLAEKVETREEFQFTRNLGYELFQGYYFERPEVVSSPSFAPMKTTFVQMQRELNHDELDYPKIEGMLRVDPAMTHRLLRYLNSAMFHLRAPVQSVRQAMVLMGDTDLRRWFFLVGLTKLAGPGNDHAVRSSLLRARFCELLAPRVGLGARGPEMFLMGLLSVLGGMLGATMAETVEGLGLSPDVSDALVGGGHAFSRLGTVYALVRAYEHADWALLPALMEPLATEEDALCECYEEAVEWTEQVFASLGV